MKVEIKTGNFKFPHKKHYIFMGGDNRNLTWNEYLEEWTEEGKEKIKLIKDIVKKEGYWKATGQDMNDKYFKFSDKSIIAFSWRAWGDFMQAAVNKREGYMTYYM